MTRRARDHLLQGHFPVVAAQITEIASSRMERIAYAQVVRKGGTSLHTGVSTLVGAGVRSGYGALRLGPRLSLGMRLDRRVFSVEARLFGAWSEGSHNGNGAIDAKGIQRGREFGAAVVGLTAVDVGATTLAVGGELGGLWLTQELGTDPSAGVASRRATVVGAVGQLQRPVLDAIYARFEVAGQAYVFESVAGVAASETRWLWSTELALGRYF